MKNKAFIKTRRTAWAVLLFYLLIAFEFFYMASPLAVYFYSVYKPGLALLDHYPTLAWTTGFFMPHLVKDTRSWLLNIREIAGLVLASTGFIVFLVCAVQVYTAKLWKKGAVTGGIYQFIRHPQYTAFMVCGFGLLLLWPRYLSLILFVTLCFAYRLLARAEEKECEAKFGQSYRSYKQRTHGFIPFTIPIRLPNWGLGQTLRVIRGILFYGLCLGLCMISAWGLKRYSVDSLYATHSNNQMTLSIYQKTTDEIDGLISLVQKDTRVDSFLTSLEFAGTKMMNYILPAGMYISEIPMFKPDDAGCHEYSQNTDLQQSKIIFTKAVFKNDSVRSGKQIPLYASSTVPALEVWVDLKKSQIDRIIDFPEATRYQNVPVPVF